MDITEVLNDSLKVRGIGSFTYHRKDFDKLVSDDIVNTRSDAVIKIAGITQKAFFTDSPGHHALIERVRAGANFRILILHPQSPITETYQNLSKEFGSPNLNLSIQSSATGTMRRVAEELGRVKEEVKGTLEVRMFKEHFSTLYVYVGSSLVLFSLYLAHRRGVLCPAFVISDVVLAKTLEQHFDRLWDVCEQHKLFLVNRDVHEDYTSKFFQTV